MSQPHTTGRATLFKLRRDGPQIAAFLLLVLLAFGLRVYHLGAQSLWYDEGISLHYASQPPAALLSLLAEVGEFPPLYFLLLHGWMALAGTSELALRFLSAVAGVLGVALLVVVGRKIGGWRLGLVAGLLLALSPLHVWQSQETRMYSVVVALGLAATYLFLRLLDGARPRLLVAFALVAAAGLYTHFTFALLLLALMVYLGVWTLSDRRRLPLALRVGLAAGAAGLLFLPWVPLVFRTYDTNLTYWAGQLDLLAAGRDTLAAFLAGELAPPLDRTTLALAAGALALVGTLAAIGKRGERRGFGLLLACLLLVPAAAMAILLLDRPKYAPRYLLVALPAFDLAVASAVVGLARLARQTAPRRPLTISSGTLGLVVGLACLLCGASALHAQYSDPRLAREHYRGLAAYLAKEASPDDAIVLLGGHIQVPFLHYYGSGPAPVYPLPDSLLPTVRQPIQQADLSKLNEIAAGRHRVWVVRWQDDLIDPAGMIVQQLEWAGHRVDPGQAFHGLQLDAFEFSEPPIFPVAFQPAKRPDVAFDDGLSLLGYDLTPLQAKPGETLRLTLYWQARSTPKHDYVAFAQLLNSAEHIYAQHDKPPASELLRTSRWQAGTLLKDTYELRVRPGTPPGDYHLQIGLYDSSTFQRSLASVGDAPPADHVALANVTVDQGEPMGPVDALTHQVSLDLAAGVRLFGWETEPATLQRGVPSRVLLLWLATAPGSGDQQVRLVLRARDGREVASSVGPPADGTYPTARWRLDDLVRDIHNLTPPADLPPGEYTLAVGLDGAGQGSPGLVDVGAVQVK